jgi:uncharacterized protein
VYLPKRSPSKMAAKPGRRQIARRTLLGLLVVVLVCSTVSMIFVKRFYDGQFPRYDKPKYSGYLQYSDVANDYARTVVSFKSGSNTLTGYVYGERNQKGLVVIAPGRGEGAERYLPQTLYFVDKGWRVFSFDYTGVHESEGANSVGLPQALTDLRAALAYIASSESLTRLPVLLFGHSQGAYAVTADLGNDHDLAAVASVSGFNSPMGLLAEYTKTQLGALGYVVYPFAWVYQAGRFGGDAFVSAVDGINSADTPVMVVHGNGDEAIAYDGASIIAQRSKITNPRVVYRTCDTALHNGHFSLFQSEAAVEYIDQKNQAYQPVVSRYGGHVPESVKAEFYAGVDHFKTSELDTGLMNEINGFFESALVGAAQ